MNLTYYICLNKNEKNISHNQFLKVMSIILSIILCLNMSFSNEEEILETENEIETEVIYHISKIEFSEINYDELNSNLFTKYLPLIFHNGKENPTPYKNVKLYIFHSQLALKDALTFL